MRKYEVVRGPDGSISPRLKPGERGFPPNDPNIVGMRIEGDHYVIYELGDPHIPDEVRNKLVVLRELPDELCLWRYMDFPRLFALVSRRALYFTPGYVLRRSDPYELQVPVKDSRLGREQWLAQYTRVFASPAEAEAEFQKLDERGHEATLFEHGVSCWHINDYENNGLWRTYVPNGGVAIKTSLGRLKRAIDFHQRYITADLVEYIDYREDNYRPHPSATGFERLYHKARFYEFERELRMVFRYRESLSQFSIRTALDGIQENRKPDFTRLLEEGEPKFLSEVPYVPVDLHELIEEVVVSPKAWFFDQVVAVLAEYVDPARIRKSSLERFGE